jgi:hypothetical protein
MTETAVRRELRPARRRQSVSANVSWAGERPEEIAYRLSL